MPCNAKQAGLPYNACMYAKALTISRVAEAAGIGVETIRYYQRIGLIDEPAKPASGYRVYATSILTRLKFIQRAKELGFSLAEIQELLSLDSNACDQTQDIAQRKLQLIQSKISDLQAMAAVLDDLLKACRGNHSHAGCPIIETLSRD
jgi:MerR family mercuric resistance operon transcriptional regulator